MVDDVRRKWVLTKDLKYTQPESTDIACNDKKSIQNLGKTRTK